ncbi:MAG: hypothetical protein LBG65_06030, partial [Puniceicoccales bacterium]|nr:hypothetical protein [Puniceicoccales bacterium]
MSLTKRKSLSTLSLRVEHSLVSRAYLPSQTRISSLGFPGIHFGNIIFFGQGVAHFPKVAPRPHTNVKGRRRVKIMSIAGWRAWWGIGMGVIGFGI